MKPNFTRIALVILLSAVLLAGCQFSRQGGRMTFNSSSPAEALPATAVPPTEIPVTPEPTGTRVPRPTATATADPAALQASQAETAARDYFAALEKKDYEAAAGLLSNFSLMVFEMTRGDAASTLHGQGKTWSNLQVRGSAPFNGQTMLVHVQFTLTSLDKDGKEVKEARDEQWPIRLENGDWRYNWNNLIDFHTLDVDSQSLNGITIKPIQVNRFTDRIQLVMLVQNRTSDPVVFGQANEILGTFHFGSEAVIAEKTQIILNPLRTVPDIKLEVKGNFQKYPDSIEIRKWKNYNVKPWFVFQLQ